MARAAAALAQLSAAEILLLTPVQAGPTLTTDAAAARVRHRRQEAEAAATAAPVTPRLAAAGLSWSVQRLDLCPGGRGRRGALDAVLRLAARRRASAS